jgi:hypothetical protein
MRVEIAFAQWSLVPFQVGEYGGIAVKPLRGDGHHIVTRSQVQDTKGP